MSASIVPQLVKKDLMISRKMILIFGLVSITSIGILNMLYGQIPDWAFGNLGSSLLIIPCGTCGIVLLIQTNVFEKAKSTQSFIMSLPVTVKEFNLAKLLVNLPVFTAFWIVTTAAAFYFAFGLGLFPLGTLPFLTMVFLGIFVAYTCILSLSLLYQSLGVTIFSIMFFEMGTSAYLWAIVYLNPISNHISGQEVIWNSTAVTIVAIQIIVIISAVSATFFIQGRKRDFI